MAPIISPTEIDIIIFHLETLTKAGPVQQRALYAELKPLLESVKDFSAFSNLLTACINYGRITGYKYVRNGCIARESYVDGDEGQHIPAKSVGFIYVDDEKIKTELNEKTLKKLLDVLGAIEDDGGNVEVGGVKYSCSDKNLLKRFLKKWF